MATVDRARATLDDLMQTEGKAELIGGRIVKFIPMGRTPSKVAFRIAQSLDSDAAEPGHGEAHPNGVGYAVSELGSGRQSFCPDASYFVGPVPANPMKFLQGPPTFAVEVRSEGDDGPAAERAIAARRADYFEAGTRVVWDVDPKAQTVLSYRADDPAHPVVFRRGETAHAGPSLAGWRIAVDRLFG